MRAFTQFRKMLSTHEDLKRKVESMEKKYDEQFQIVFEAIKQLIETDEKPKKEIGFTVKETQKAYAKRGFGAKRTCPPVSCGGNPDLSGNPGICFNFRHFSSF